MRDKAKQQQQSQPTNNKAPPHTENVENHMPKERLLLPKPVPLMNTYAHIAKEPAKPKNDSSDVLSKILIMLKKQEDFNKKLQHRLDILEQSTSKNRSKH